MQRVHALGPVQRIHGNGQTLQRVSVPDGYVYSLSAQLATQWVKFDDFL